MTSKLRGSGLLDAGYGMFWHFSHQKVLLYYPFVFNVMDLVIQVPDIPMMFLTEHSPREALYSSPFHGRVS